MSKEETLNKENSKRKFSDWFWDITTRWYFFPVFYVMLALILTFSLTLKGRVKFSEFFRLLGWLLALMPLGISLVFPILSKKKFEYITSVLLYAFPLFSVAVIQYYKIKKKKIIKWLIMTLVLYLLLCFYGCAIQEGGI